MTLHWKTYIKFLRELFEAKDAFFLRAPALHLGLNFFLSIWICYSFSVAGLIAAVFLNLFLLHSRRLLRNLWIYPLWAAVFFLSGQAALPEGPSHVAFRILRVNKVQEGARTYYLYKGALREVEGKRHLGRFVTSSKRRYVAGFDYRVLGTLEEVGVRSYKLHCHGPWKMGAKYWSFVENQSGMTEVIKCYLESRLGKGEVSGFLFSLCTGQFPQKTLAEAFRRAGLLHLMAVSGFHFAFLASLMGWLLTRLMPARLASFFLILLLSSYFLIVGGGPSVWRAWIMCLIRIFAYILGRPVDSINSLGVALVAVLLLDPFCVGDLGFQFSFLATGALLILLRPVDWALTRVFFYPSFCEFNQLVRLNLNSLIVNWVKNSLALSITVHLVTVPLILAACSEFHFLSFIYNTFYPTLVALAFFLLFLAPLTNLVVPYTEILIRLVSELPTFFDWTLHLPVESRWAITLFWSVLFTCGIVANHRLLDRGRDFFV